jgi:glucose-6-phosphate isomerase
MRPFKRLLNMENGRLDPCSHVIERRLSDMRGMWLDTQAYNKLLNQEDRLIYKIYEVDVPQEAGQLVYSTTIIGPGKVGDEYFMTKGHFHLKEDTAEIYFCLQGEGYLLMQTRGGQVSSIRMKSGTIAYVPPYWGHRTMNTGDKEFIFLAVFPGDAGHDYRAVEERGFAEILVEEGGGPQLKRNPKFVAEPE